MKRRKGWHRKKRRLRHDHWAQFANTLWNNFVRWRESARVHREAFERFLVEAMSKAEE